MAIDFSDYSNNKKNISQLVVDDKKHTGIKRKTIYLAIILICLCGILLAGVKLLPISSQSVEETLPPGVPLEAPGLEELQMIAR